MIIKILLYIGILLFGYIFGYISCALMTVSKIEDKRRENR